MLTNFLKAFPASDVREVSPNIFADYRDKIPKELFKLWETSGFGKYGNGIIEIINPEEYEYLLWSWLGKLAPNYTPFAISAFGELFYYRKLTETDEDICVIDIQRKNIETLVWSANEFFNDFIGSKGTQQAWLSRKIFDEAFAKFGALPIGSIYMYAPLFALGGAEKVENLHVGDAKVYHNIVFQFFGISEWDDAAIAEALKGEDSSHDFDELLKAKPVDAEPSEDDKKALKIMQKWQAGKHYYSLFVLQELELHPDIEEIEDLDAWFNNEVEGKIPDKFYQFGSDPTGGNYVLWFYPGLEGPAPVVFFGSEGETNVLAPSLKDFVCLLSTGKALRATYSEEDRTINSVWGEVYKHEFEDMATDYNCKVPELKKHFNTDVSDFKKRVEKVFSCKTETEIFAQAKDIPDFIKWTGFVYEKFENGYEGEEEKDPLCLDMTDHHLTVVPESVIENPYIKTLDLSDNRLDELPDFMSKLKTLKNLSAKRNDLIAIPKFVETFVGLEELDVCNNNITTIDLDFSKMRSLNSIDISDNPIKLAGLNPSIYACKNLNYILYSDTGISEEISNLAFILKFDSKDILDEVEEYTELDRREWSKKDLKVMEQIYLKRLELYPSSETNYDMGYFFMYKLADRLEEAIPYLEEAIALKDCDFDAMMYTELGRLYYAFLERDFDKAEKYFKLGAELTGDENGNEEYTLKHYARFLLYEKEDYEEADKVYSRLIELDPTDMKHLSEYAEMYHYYTEEHEKAAKIYKRLIKLDSTKKKWLQRYANLLSIDMGNHKKSLKWYRKLLKKKKKEEYYVDYLFALVMGEEAEELIEKVFAKALKRYPKSQELKENYADYRLDQGDDSIIKEVMTEHPDNIEMVLRYCVFVMEQGAFADAIPFIDQSLTLKPEETSLLVNKAICLEFSEGTEEEIEALYQRILELKPAGEIEHFTYLTYLIRQERKDDTLVELANKTLPLVEGDERKAGLCKSVIRRSKFDKSKINNYRDEVNKLSADVPSLVKDCQKEYQKGSMEKGVAIIERLEGIDPFKYDVMMLHFSIILDLEGKDKAHNYLAEKYALEPKNISVLRALVDANMLHLRYEEAKKWIAKALEVEPDSQGLIDLLAHLNTP